MTLSFSVKRISMMMLILGEVVESKITKMLETAKAVGLYDGFTRNATHYVALYASFIEGERRASSKTKVPPIASFYLESLQCLA